MKRFAVTTMLAGSIFAGLLGATGTAHADLGDVIYTQQQYAVRCSVRGCTSRTSTPASARRPPSCGTDHDSQATPSPSRSRPGR